MPGPETGAKNVTSRPAGGSKIDEPEQVGSTRWYRRLRRWKLRVSLSPLQQLLALRLAARHPITFRDPDVEEAAIAVVIGSDPDAFLIIQRAERSGDPWSGHMGLPGGRRGPRDEYLLATAIRETAEEVGLMLHPSSLLGCLDDEAPRSRSRPGIFARPYAFAVKGHPPLVPNQEVSGAFWIDLTTFRTVEVFREFTLLISGTSRTFPAYHTKEGVIWGMTERVLTSVLRIVEPPQA